MGAAALADHVQKAFVAHGAQKAAGLVGGCFEELNGVTARYGAVLLDEMENPPSVLGAARETGRPLSGEAVRSGGSEPA